MQCEKENLEEYRKNGNAQSLKISCRAVNEAINSPWKKHNDNCEQMKLNIVVALVAKLQQNNQDKDCMEDWTVDDDTDYFDAVIVGLPSFNRTFLYDLVKNCDMSKQLCQVYKQLRLN